MQALVYDDAQRLLYVDKDRPQPTAGASDALIRVLRAGVCSTDIEITRGYVPGYHQVLGHEFVGRVVECSSQPDLVGTRVAGEINCNCAKFTCSDAIFQRNHAPGRMVMGIINKDGTLAEYVTLPVENLHRVPDSLTDAQACFTEPLAAACRIIEQGVTQGKRNIAVIGDGKLGLLVAQALVCHGGPAVTLFGKHVRKMDLVSGLENTVVMNADVANQYSQAFDLTVEATGSSAGIRTALAVTRAMGTVLLKSTVSLKDPNAPLWSELANDVVVNEKIVVGSRCGPFALALEMMSQHEAVRKLLDGMLHRVFPLAEAVEAMQYAQQKGVLKVQVSMDNA